MSDGVSSSNYDNKPTLKTSKSIHEDGQGVEESPKTIREELRSLWREYRASASIHGIAITNGVRLYAKRRIIWACLVIAMAVTLGVTLYNQLSLLQGYPIKTKVVVDYVNQMDFPSVSICNMNQFYRDRIPDNPSVNTVIYYMSEFSGFNLSFKSEVPSPIIPRHLDVAGDELRNIQIHAAHRLEDMFLPCQWRRITYPCDELFTPKLTYFGMCYTFNGNTTSELRQAYSTGPFEGLRVFIDIQQDQYYFASTIKAGIQVVIEKPGEATFPVREGLSFRPGVSAFVALTREEKKGLPYPYHAYGNNTCLDTKSSSFKNPVRRFEYKLSACMMDCIYDYMIEQCNCTFYNDPIATMGLGVRLCNASELLYCYGPELQTDVDTIKLCGCKWPCDVVSFQPTISYADISSSFVETLATNHNFTSDNYIRTNLIDLNIYFKSMGILKVIQEPEISVNEIVGTLGGQMGLFLGASILSITEILEIAMLFMCRTCSLIWNRMKNCGGAKKISDGGTVESKMEDPEEINPTQKGWVVNTLKLEAAGADDHTGGF